MTAPRGTGFLGAFANRRFRIVLWLLLGTVGWGTLMVLGLRGLSVRPAVTGFDLELLLDAGRHIANGLSPYRTQDLASGVQAESLFYSYPPPVGQAMALLAWAPSPAVFVAWGVGAAAGLGAIAAVESRLLRPGRDILETVVAVLGIAPFVYPFAVAILFGNFDAWFPLLYGLLLIGVLASSPGWWVAAGVAVGIMAVAKLHPALLLVWLLVRAVRSRRRPALPDASFPASSRDPAASRSSTPWILLIALGAVAFACLASLLAGGVAPWQDWLELVRAGSSAEITTWLNIGPGAQLALATGGGDALARVLAAGAAAIAAAVAAWAAWRRSDPIESLAIAAAASLVTLPVTWFHYPVAMIPFAIAAWVRVRGRPAEGAIARLLVAAVLASGLAILWPVAVWLSVALVVMATRLARVSPRSTLQPASELDGRASEGHEHKGD